MSKRYAVIMAGGSGTRLWPMSRSREPKQLLKLTPEKKSLIRISMERLAGLFRYDEIFVIAAQNHIGPISEELPEIPRENLIPEPFGRDTANAVGLSAAILHCKDPNSIMGIFTADHIIEPILEFQDAVKLTFDTIEKNPNALGAFGIKPDKPHTGLGYIHRGQPISDRIFHVSQFKEKPDIETAERYVKSGEYYWNSGMFVWKTETILKELQTNLPENTSKLLELGKMYGTAGWNQKATEVYHQLKKISIDFAVMEQARNVIVVELDCRWADVGNWTELEKVVGLNENLSAVLGGTILEYESGRNVVVSNDDSHLIALIGVNDFVVVHTSDATLVCPKNQVQKVKDAVGVIEKKCSGKYS